MSDETMSCEEAEALRQDLLDDLYACAFSGFPAVLCDEEEILNATPEELEHIAWRYGRR